MIIKSVPAMTVIDLCIIGLCIFSIIIYKKHLSKLKGLNLSSPVFLILLGVVLFALFYLTDLIFMHLLPVFVPVDVAMAMMKGLHYNYSWIMSVLVIVSMVVGFARLIRVLSHEVTAIVDTLEKSQKDLERDIYERKLAEESLSQYKVLFDNIPDLAYICDDKGNIIYVNRVFKSLSGFSPKEFIGRSFAPLFDDQNLKQAQQHYQETLKGNNQKFELRFKKTGVLCEYHNFPISDNTGKIIGIAGISRDITERKSIEEEFKKLATTDRLTQAYNRIKFESLLETEMERAKRYNEKLAMIMLDIDHFKEINDTYGHLYGDRVLKSVAKILRHHMRKVNHLVRWGGEEFLIIAPETDLEGAEILAERIREEIHSNVHENGVTITASLGVAGYQIDNTEDEFIHNVDQALYRAKRNGRNRVEICDPEKVYYDDQQLQIPLGIHKASNNR